MDNPFTILQTEIEENRKIILELRSLVKSLIKDRPEIYLSPEEARKRFSPAISKSTLYRWQKDGLVKRYIKGGRAVYKESEILENAENLKPYKKAIPNMEMPGILQ
jgi:hypothetical protein